MTKQVNRGYGDGSGSAFADCIPPAVHISVSTPITARAFEARFRNRVISLSCRAGRAHVPASGPPGDGSPLRGRVGHSADDHPVEFRLRFVVGKELEPVVELAGRAAELQLDLDHHLAIGRHRHG
jgi:hypothetical protein